MCTRGFLFACKVSYAKAKNRRKSYFFEVCVPVYYLIILVPRGRAPFGQHQESRFLVLTTGSAASGDENAIQSAHI